MIHTDKFYHQPTVFKMISCLDTHITLDTCTAQGRSLHLDNLGYVDGTYLKPVSYVSNDAAAYPIV